MKYFRNINEVKLILQIRKEGLGGMKGRKSKTSQSVKADSNDLEW